MFIKRFTLPTGRRRLQAWSLVDLMVGVSIFSITGLALASLSLFGVRSYTALANYAILDQYNRQAMDQFTYELRQCRSILNYNSNTTSRSIDVLNGDGLTVTYTFDSARQRVTRAASDGSFKVLLTNCNLLNFNLYLRPPTNGSFDVYPVDMTTNWQQTVKVIQLSWKTSMSICPTTQVNSEDIQTARIVIRKQQD